MTFPMMERIPFVYLQRKLKEDTNGSIICDLLSYDKFNLGKIETFCNEQYKKSKRVIICIGGCQNSYPKAMG